MTDLLWPGDARADDIFDDAVIVDAMVAVEQAWLDALVVAGIAPAAARVELRPLVSGEDIPRLALDAEWGGNPAVPLVELLRERAVECGAEATAWVHRGLTSQDVLDTALMIAAREALSAVRAELRHQVGRLVDLVEDHRSTPMVARTLTRYAVPTTFGAKAAAWLTGTLDAYDDLAAVVFPAQLGGAAGTMAAAVELAQPLPAPVEAVTSLLPDVAARLGLTPSTPWHTVRTSTTRLGDAALRCTDAWGHLARDVLQLTRPEVGELSLVTTGGSSTMPGKQNPVLAVLVHRAALGAPPLASTLHLAAADTVDERSDGAWHLEWPTLRTLLRRTVVAGRQTSALLDGLVVHPEAMAARLVDAQDNVRAEQGTMAGLVGREPAAEYVGAVDSFVEAPLARAVAVLAQGDR